MNRKPQTSDTQLSTLDSQLFSVDDEKTAVGVRRLPRLDQTFTDKAAAPQRASRRIRRTEFIPFWIIPFREQTEQVPFYISPRQQLDVATLLFVPFGTRHTNGPTYVSCFLDA